MMASAKKQGEAHARIGMVNFINTAPIYEVWKKKVHRPEWSIVAAPPRTLNRMLFLDELDMGCVSSVEYATHPAKYRILSDLSISASGPVGSVFLFSKAAPENLTGLPVLLSNQSQTSVSLVKIILEEFYYARPRYITGAVCEPGKERKTAEAVLAIGDDALRLAKQDEYKIRLDLGEVWQQHTGLPFVFAVWTVRKEFCEKQPECVREIHRELLRCLAEGKRNLAAISRKVAPRIPMTPELCLNYLQSMEYDLGSEKLKALESFYEILIKRGEGNALALPLQFFPASN